MTYKYTNYTISPELDAFDIYAKADFVLGKSRPEYREWLEAFKPKIHIDTDQESIHRGIFLVISPHIFSHPQSTQIRIAEDLLVEYLDAQLGFTKSEVVCTAALKDSDSPIARMTIGLSDAWDGFLIQSSNNGAFLNNNTTPFLSDVLASERMLFQAWCCDESRLEEFANRYQEGGEMQHRLENLYSDLLPISKEIETPSNVSRIMAEDLRMRDHFDTITENPDNKSPQELFELSFPHFYPHAERFLGMVKNVAQLKKDHPTCLQVIQDEDTASVKKILCAGTTSDAIEWMLRDPSIDKGVETLLSATLEFFQNISLTIPPAAYLAAKIDGKTFAEVVAAVSNDYELAAKFRDARRAAENGR